LLFLITFLYLSLYSIKTFTRNGEPIIIKVVMAKFTYCGCSPETSKPAIKKVNEIHIKIFKINTKAFGIFTLLLKNKIVRINVVGRKYINVGCLPSILNATIIAATTMTTPI